MLKLTLFIIALILIIAEEWYRERLRQRKIDELKSTISTLKETITNIASDLSKIKEALPQLKDVSTQLTKKVINKASNQIKEHLQSAVTSIETTSKKALNTPATDKKQTDEKFLERLSWGRRLLKHVKRS